CVPPDRLQLQGESMGTTWSATLAGPALTGDAREAARSAIQAALDEVEGAMSTWLPDSELSRFNRYEGRDLFALSPSTLEVLAIAREVSERSGGAFDVTVRPLVAAWGFGAGARIPGEGPDEEERAAILARVGWEKLEVDAAAGGARKRHPQLEVDLSAVAKGYGVDRAAAALVAAGREDFLFELGGEIAVRGRRPDGRLWRLAVERPQEEGRAVFGVVELDGQAMATSGDYRSFYEAGDERLTHLLDPRIGRPIAHGLASVSVVADSAAVADAWATALSVLGPEEGVETAETLGLAAYFLVRSAEGGFEARATSRFPAVETAADGAARSD
ncbi:MAG: FAD:protein FMN transferase, partial [Myxococcota bacterium]